MRYDLAIIGSGGAAFAAAIAARDRGASVAMVERDLVGGTCVNHGCVPSKALLAAADTRHVSLAQSFPGIATHAGPVDFGALAGAKAELVETMRHDKYLGLAAEHGWDILEGAARFVSGPALEVTLGSGGTTRVEAEHYLIATGSSPWVPPISGLEQTGYLTSATAMELGRLPASMIVLGGGAIGLEQAQLFARLGVAVTVVEALGRLAPLEEPEISAVVEGVFADEGIAVYAGALVTDVHRGNSGYVLTASRDGCEVELKAEQLLVATGRRPASDGLGLEEIGVKVGESGEVVVDAHLRTHNPHVWAAGDVIGHPQFVYVAAAHGSLVTENALEGSTRTVEYDRLPRVTFTSPAIAAVGLTESRAVSHGHRCDARILPLKYVPRAVVDRDIRGLIKLVAEAGTGRLLGAHVVAEGAGDVIAAAVYALTNGMTVQQMADLWCPYLTMAEGLKLAAQTYSRDVTRLSCCAS
ncbi:mercury(II) reductase [Actinomadura nitritigenes]|uniref:mercury(II) reductase n=1 Tax=Actinomadura nitritigenes TaxID=134602 RepID=UPI003D92E46F